MPGAAMFALFASLRGMTKATAVLLILLLINPVRNIIIPSRDDNGLSVIIRHVGLIIDQTDQFFSSTTQSECECRMNCGVAGDRCRGYSFNKLSKVCRLASTIHTGELEEGGVYVYTLETGLPPGSKKQGDGLYYILEPSDNVTQAEARERCARHPGYRLAQAKSVQTMELMKNMWYSSEAKLWRDDRRCGALFPLAAPFEGRPAECDPWPASKCCSSINYCGVTWDHCSCPGCKDFSEGMPRVNSGDFWIDLSKDPIGGGGAAGAEQWVWGDGTVLDQALVTSNEPVVNGDGSMGALIARYKVHEAASDALHGYLCQANYDDVSW